MDPLGQWVLRGRHGHARVAVLSVIDEEFAALRDELGARCEIGNTGAFSTSSVQHDQDFPFVLAQCHSRSNIPAGEATRRLVEQFRPEIFLLVGIAGGIQRPVLIDRAITWSGPQPGDVVVGEYIHYADFTKNLASGHYLRYFPIDHPAQFLVGTHARILMYAQSVDESWHHRLSVPRPALGDPCVHIGEVVAVESVAGDPASERQAEFLRRFDNALAVDMESMGVGRTLHEIRDQVYYNPLWMCVRGVSDAVRSDRELKALLRRCPEAASPSGGDENNDQRSRWKKYAAATAARYAARLLGRLLDQPRMPIAVGPSSATRKRTGAGAVPAIGEQR